MTSTEGLDTIILIGSGALLGKWFLAGVSTLWVYDYFLTLADEIGWGWPGKKPWGLALFILNRYWPVWWLSWKFVAFWDPEYTRPMCRKSSWLSMFYFTFATFFAQVVITLRVHAVTRKNRWVTSYLSLITLGQFGFGVYLTVTYALRPVMELPDIPLDEYQACLPQPLQAREIVYSSISIAYDTFAFVAIVYSTRGLNRMRLAGIPNLFGNIVENATLYFLIIFTNHLVVILFELFTHLPIQLLPSCVTAVMMPMMTTRLWVSLKKAANPPDSTSANMGSLRFARPTIEVAEDGSDDIPPEDISPGERAGPSELRTELVGTP